MSEPVKVSGETATMLLILCFAGGLGFGYWQGSFGAGLFGTIFLMAIWRHL